MIQVLKACVNQEHGDFHADESVARGDKRPLQLGQVDARNLLVDITHEISSRATSQKRLRNDNEAFGSGGLVSSAEKALRPQKTVYRQKGAYKRWTRKRGLVVGSETATRIAVDWLPLSSRHFALES